MLAELAVRPCPRISLNGRSPASARGRVRYDLLFGPSQAVEQPLPVINSWEGDEARDERRREGDRYAAVKGGRD